MIALAVVTADWLSTPTCTGDGERLNRRTPPASVRPEVMASPASLGEDRKPEFGELVVGWFLRDLDFVVVNGFTSIRVPYTEGTECGRCFR